jgi:hypothetical protein
MVKKNDCDWNGPQSSEEMGREKLRKDSSGLGYPEPKSILSRVDKAQSDDGFSGKLPSDE